VLGGVVVLCTAEWPDETLADCDVVDAVGDNSRGVQAMLQHLVDRRGSGTASLGADFYVSLSRDRLARVLAPRDR
jgi:hypothetical protein